MDEQVLLSGFRNYLVAQGLVRKPSVAGAVPPLWIEPQDGVPAPGEKQGTEDDAHRVLGVFYTAGLAPRPYEKEYRTRFVDVVYRTKEVGDLGATFVLNQAIFNAIVDKRNWSMAGVQILESLEWRALQRVSSDPQGYLHSVGYVFYTSNS